MNWLKHDCVCLQIRFLLTLVCVLSCGRAFALPQDWPCESFVVRKIAEQKTDNSDVVKYFYEGMISIYHLGIEIDYISDKPSRLDDCGTAGCTGLIKNTQTNETEYLSFYCEPINNGNFNALQCSIHNGLEYLFTKINNYVYRAKRCNNHSFDFYQLDVRKCQKCNCLISYYLDDKKQDDSLLLACNRDSADNIRCYTAEGYVLKKKLNANIKDYENCVGLSL